ncbi:MAG: hypothetical protein HRT37_14815 [Alteromonadaceae bacterium]|nr:hypothetical protein [Alteromonadaceae bacterium]
MNLVFNKMRILPLVLICFSSISSADECASVNLLPTQINGKTYILNLLSDNGHRRFEKRVYKNFKNLVIEPQQYYLAEGSHTLTIEQWYSEDYRGTLNNTYDAYNTKKIPNIYFTRNRFATAIQTKVIQLNVKAGHKYSLNLSSNNLDAQVHVETETKLTCVADSSEILNAKEELTSELQDTFSLTKSLDYRLHRIMAEINSYHNNIQKNNIHSSLVPLNASDIFGITTDNIDSTHSDGIRVLSVFPYSFASQLGLASGDKIIALGDEPVINSVKLPLQVLSEYFDKIFIGGAIKIKVVRNSKEIAFSSKYIPVISPEVKYRVSGELTSTENILSWEPILINPNQLPDDLNFSFNQLMLEINDYYREYKNINSGSIRLVREAQEDIKFGLVGEIVKTNNTFGYRVTSIESGSPGDLIGLINGDIIVSAGSHNYRASNFQSLKMQFATLESGKEYTLTVKRQDKEITLDDIYRPKILPSFVLDIDLSSVNLAHELLNDAHQTNVRWKRSKRSKRFNIFGRTSTGYEHPRESKNARRIAAGKILDSHGKSNAYR